MRRLAGVVKGLCYQSGDWLFEDFLVSSGHESCRQIRAGVSGGCFCQNWVSHYQDHLRFAEDGVWLVGHHLDLPPGEACLRVMLVKVR